MISRTTFIGAVGLFVLIACTSTEHVALDGEEEGPPEPSPVSTIDASLSATAEASTPEALGCTNGAIESRSCGVCGGKEERLCEDGRWLPYGYCREPDGTCQPGEERRSACGRCVEQCNASCSFDAPVCPSDVCVEGTVEEDPQGCIAGRVRTRVCTNCAMGSWSSCGAPKGWTTMAPLPAGVNGRAGYAAGFRDGTMYLAGGSGPTVSTVLAYDLALDTWSVKAACPFLNMEALNVNAILGYPDRIGTVWIDDGFVSVNFVTGEAASYSVATDTWTSLSAPPLSSRTRARLAYVSATREVVIWGGISGGALTDGAAYSLQEGTWRTLPAAPIGGATTALFAEGARLRGVSGGGTPSEVTMSHDLVAGTFTSPEFSFIVPSYVSVPISGTKVAMWGGRERSGTIYTSSDKIAFRTVAADDWTNVVVPTSVLTAPKREGLAAWWEGDRICGWGGASFVANSRSGNDHGTGACYDVVSTDWTQLPSGGPTARTGVTAVWTGKEAILWGGGVIAYLGPSRAVADGKIWRP